MSRNRNWVFTLNNYSEQEMAVFLTLPETARYLCVGEEVGSNGTKHLQGYIVFKNALTLGSCKKLSPRAHWEVRKGSHEQARDYCMKDGHFWIRGDPPLSQEEKGEKGKQSIAERWALAKEGKFEELPPEQIKTYEYIYRKNLIRPDRDQLENYWICGPSGCGKSSLVRRHFTPFYDKRINKWWDGYMGEDIVLIDDIDDKHDFIAHDLKRWSDHYAFNAEVKGGMLHGIRPKVLVITSQYRIGQVFKDYETCSAISRRFKEVCFKGDGFYINDQAFDVSFTKEPTPFVLEPPPLQRQEEMVMDIEDEVATLIDEPLPEDSLQDYLMDLEERGLIEDPLIDFDYDDTEY